MVGLSVEEEEGIECFTSFKMKDPASNEKCENKNNPDEIEVNNLCHVGGGVQSFAGDGHVQHWICGATSDG